MLIWTKPERTTEDMLPTIAAKIKSTEKTLVENALLDHFSTLQSSSETIAGKTLSTHLFSTNNSIDLIVLPKQQFVLWLHKRWDQHWIPQSKRIDKELWGYVNFVGQFDSLAEDTKRMLERLGHGAWEKFGSSGWGEFHNESAFVQSNTATHRTSARTKLSQYINETIVEKMIDDFYSEDYMHAQFNFSRYSISLGTV